MVATQPNMCSRWRRIQSVARSAVSGQGASRDVSWVVSLGHRAARGCECRMDNDRSAQSLGAAIAGVWLVVLIVLDLAISDPAVSLAPLFALAPLIACAVLPARATAVVAAAAVAATIGSGWWNNTAGAPQHLVRI